MTHRSCSLACLLVLSALPACGESDSHREAPEADAATGGATGAGGRASGGASSTGGRAAGGAPGTGASGGAPGAGGDPSSGGSSAGGSDGGLADASSDALPDAPTPVDASLDAADSAPQDAVAEAGPAIDAGLGCESTLDLPLTPSQVGLPAAGLVLWLRADRGIYKTASNAVCAWRDQSGGERVFRSAPAARPLWDPAGASSLPAVQLRSGQGLSVGDVLGIPAQSARTFVAVQTLATPAARFSAIIQGQSGTPGTYVSLDTNTFQTAGSREGVYVTNNGYDSSLATSTATRLHVFTVGPMVVGTAILPELHYRVNSAELTLTRTPGGLGNGNFESFAGANFTAVGAGTGASEVMLSEVLAYDHALSGAELTAVEAALSARYGLD